MGRIIQRWQQLSTKAEPLYERALSIREQTLPPRHPDLGQSLNNLALVYKMEGKYEQAELLYKKALMVWEEALGPNDPNVATVLENMAELYRELGKYDMGAKLDSRARKIRQGLGQR